MTKEDVCKARHSPVSEREKHLYLNKNKELIIESLGSNLTKSPDWENYCMSSKTISIIACPEKILKTIKDEMIQNQNRGFSLWAKKIKKKRASRKKANLNILLK